MMDAILTENDSTILDVVYSTYDPSSYARSGVLAEVRKREAYEKPSVRRKKKSEAARKRKYK